MQVVVYADVIFIVNLVMDFIILTVTARLCGQNIRLVRIILAAIISAGFYCLVFFEKTKALVNFFSTYGVLCLCLYISFIPKNLRAFLKLFGATHVSAFCMGGIAYAMFYFVNTPVLSVGGITGQLPVVRNFPLMLLIWSVSLFYVLFKLTLSWLRSRELKKQAYYTAKIFVDNQSISLNTLVDTGNTLRDPLTDYPVIIAEFDSVKDVLPRALRQAYREKNESDLLMAVTLTDFAKRIRMIPFTSLGSKNGLLMGFRPDRVEILQEGKTVSIERVVVGVYNVALSAEGTYNGLLSPELIEH